MTKEKEFNLSEEIHEEFGRFQTPTYNFKHLRNLELKVNKKIKEFIKRLKKDYLKLGTRILNNKSDQDVLDIIDKLAGEINRWILFTEEGIQVVPYILDLSNEDVNEDEISLCIQEQVYGDKIK